MLTPFLCAQSTLHYSTHAHGLAARLVWWLVGLFCPLPRCRTIPHRATPSSTLVYFGLSLDLAHWLVPSHNTRWFHFIAVAVVVVSILLNLAAWPANVFALINEMKYLPLHFIIFYYFCFFGFSSLNQIGSVFFLSRAQFICNEICSKSSRWIVEWLAGCGRSVVRHWLSQQQQRRQIFNGNWNCANGRLIKHFIGLNLFLSWVSPPN